MHDVGGVNHGSELRFGYSYDWRGDRWTLRPDISCLLYTSRCV